MKQLSENKIQGLKEKDTRVHKIQPFYEQAALEYVLDDPGFISRDAELPAGDKAD
jgi:hypothetical protein